MIGDLLLMSRKIEQLEQALAVAERYFELMLKYTININELNSIETYKSLWERDKRDATSALKEIKAIKEAE